MQASLQMEMQLFSILNILLYVRNAHYHLFTSKVTSCNHVGVTSLCGVRQNGCVRGSAILMAVFLELALR